MGHKIAIYIPDLGGGGAQRMMVTLANEFANKGLDVDLVVASFEGPYCSDINEDVRIVDLKASRAITSLPGLTRYLRRERPDGILSTLMYANTIMAFAHIFSRSSGIFVVRQPNSIRPKEKVKSLKGVMTLLLTSISYFYADQIIGISGGVSEEVRGALGVSIEKIKTIYNPAFNHKINKLKSRQPDKLRKDRQYILAVGRLMPQKDFSTLLRAFARVRENRPGMQLIILGEGNERGRLEREAQNLDIIEAVSMPGFVDNPFGYMNGADVFVLSSRWEGFGNVLVEAMACGTPVVSTDCPSGPSEILQDGRFGYLVPVEDDEALAQAIADTLDDPPVSSDRLRKRAKDFAPEKIASQYLEVLLGS